MLQFVDATSITRNGNVVSFASAPVTTATQGHIGHVVMNQAPFPLYSGTAGFRILLYEIGHALGLVHSDNGNDTVFGNDTNYEIDGGIGYDTRTGGSGVDRLNGGTDADTMTYYDCNERIFSNSGDDIIHGGTGNDRFIFNVGEKETE